MNEVAKADRLVVMTNHPQAGEEIFVIPFEKLQRFKKPKFKNPGDLKKYLKKHRLENLHGAALLLADYGEDSGT